MTKRMNLKDRREQFKKACAYRSEPGTIGEVYLGSMAIAQIISLLGSVYGEQGIDEAVDNATTPRLAEAEGCDVYKWILEHYLKDLETRKNDSDVIINKFKNNYKVLCETSGCVIEMNTMHGTFHVVLATDDTIQVHLSYVK